MELAFQKGLSVLESLAHADDARGISEIANELKMTKSNVHRVLQALVQRGYASQDPVSNRYKLTLKIWELGAQVLARIDLKEIAAPFLLDLAERTAETVHLSVLDGANVIYIDKIDSPQPVRAYSKMGGRAPAYCVATGKAMLAFQSDEVVKRAGAKMARYTPKTFRNIGDLNQDLERVRRLGYAINRGEWHEGVCGIAAPIRDSSGIVIAAVGLSGPAHRMSASIMRKFGPKVMQAANAISRNLGAPLARTEIVDSERTAKRRQQDRLNTI